MLVAINAIQIGKRLRGLRETTVADLVGSIGRMGLRTPISVATGIEKRTADADGVSFELVAGAHRLEACRRLGWDEIEATIVQMSSDERLLWEIDENLCRADLTELERGEHLAQRKAVYERLYPETKRGANMGPDGQFGPTAITAFVPDASEKTGASKTAVKRAIRRATRIDEKVRDRIRDNPEIADSGVELDALASLDPPEQRKAVALVETNQAVGIRDAVKLMKPKAAKPNFKPQMAADDKWWQQFVTLMGKASEANRQRAREYLDEPIADKTALRAVS